VTIFVILAICWIVGNIILAIWVQLLVKRLTEIRSILKQALPNSLAAKEKT
jgi:hypothetical protein